MRGKLKWLCVMALLLGGCGRTAINPATFSSYIGPVLRLQQGTVGGGHPQGTGFLLRSSSGKKYLVTAGHVLKAPGKLLLFTYKGEQLDVVLGPVSIYEREDIAVIPVYNLNKNIKCFEVGEPPAIGQRVVSVGIPGKVGRPVYSEGIAQESLLFSSCTVGRGMSGGPLLNSRGKVVGVICGKLAGDREGSVNASIHSILPIINCK